MTAVIILSISMSFQVSASSSDSVSFGTTAQDYKNWNASVEKQIQVMDNRIEKNISTLNKYNETLKKLNNDISKNQGVLSCINNDIKDVNIVAKKRIKNMYVMGSGEGYLSILLSCKSLDDLISKTIAVKTLVDFDNYNIKKLENDKKSKETIMKKLENDRDNTVKLKNSISKEIDTLNVQKENEKKLLSNLSSSNLSERGDFRDSLSRGSFASSNDVVNYALSFLGVPYVWGGTSPSGFDCSGFMQYVYAHFGINLPRTSEEQQTVGTTVSRNGLMPGDLVFFGTPAYHVGMYIGNGEFVEAPHTGDVVKIANLGDYTSAVRVR